MKRSLAIALTGAITLATAWAEPPILTFPDIPSREALDRLNLKLAWRARVPMQGFRDGIATVQNLGDLLVVQSRHGLLVAFDANTGAVRWQGFFGEPYPVAHAVGMNSSLVFLANGTRIFGIDRANGKMIWDVDLPTDPASPPSASEDIFYVCGSDGRLGAFLIPGSTYDPNKVTDRPAKKPAQAKADPKSKTKTSPAPVTKAPRAADVSQSSAALAGGANRSAASGVSRLEDRSATTAMQASGGRSAVGTVDVTHGGYYSSVRNAPRLLWGFQTNLRIQERPIISGPDLFVVGTDRKAIFLDQKAERPQPFITDAPISAPLGQYGDIAFIPCDNGSVYAVNIKNRTELWHMTIAGAIYDEPQAVEDEVYVIGERAGLTKLSLNRGDLMWSNPEAVHFLAANTKFVYALDGLNRLLVLDRARGITLTGFDMRRFNVRMANDLSDRIYLGANDGTIICLHDKEYVDPLEVQVPPVTRDKGAKKKTEEAPKAGGEEKPAEENPMPPAPEKPKAPARPIMPKPAKPAEPQPKAAPATPSAPNS